MTNSEKYRALFCSGDTGSTSTEVRSPTSTSTEVRSPTSTSTDAYTQGNFTATVTGGAGAGPTHVTINVPPLGSTPDSRGRKQLGKTALDVNTNAAKYRALFSPSDTGDIMPRPNVVPEAIGIAAGAGAMLGFLIARTGLGALVGAGAGYGLLYAMYPPREA